MKNIIEIQKATGVSLEQVEYRHLRGEELGDLLEKLFQNKSVWVRWRAGVVFLPIFSGHNPGSARPLIRTTPERAVEIGRLLKEAFDVFIENERAIFSRLGIKK